MSTSRLLIGPAELAACMAGDDPPVIADCRFVLGDAAAGEQAYARSHVPGAHYLHLDRDLSGPRGATGGRHPLPSPEVFGSTLARIEQQMKGAQAPDGKEPRDGDGSA